MTTGRPPWKLYSRQTPEPQGADTPAAGDESRAPLPADAGVATAEPAAGSKTAAAGVATPVPAGSGPAGSATATAAGTATAAPAVAGATRAAAAGPAETGATTVAGAAAGPANAGTGPAGAATSSAEAGTVTAAGAASPGAADVTAVVTSESGSATAVTVVTGTAGTPSATALPQRAGPRAPVRHTGGQRQQGWTVSRPRETSAPGAASSPGEGAATRPGLSARLSALAQLIRIGASRRDAGFDGELLQDAEQLLGRAGERLRLSDRHTVVALAGGTGSGKSSLFNRLVGANLSAVGVTRPVTRHPHACVWGAAGSGQLLDWLGVPRRFRYSRGSALDSGESALNGLVLVDLPDHDSVAGGASGQVEKLVGMTDLMVWVLDPQKYADAAVHQRYLVPLAGHSAVIAVVLNQADLLTEAEIEECGEDLRRLLDSEGLQNAPLLVTSAETGAGLDQLRTMLGNAVSQRRATGVRISADLDGIAEEFLPYARQQKERTQPADRDAEFRVPAAQAQALEDEFLHAAGASAVVDALESARQLRAVDYIGWPVAWLAERITGRNPMRKIRLGRLWEEVKGIAAGPSGAQQAEIDSALTKLADAVGRPLPRPWSQTTRAALRSRSDEIPAALGAAMRDSLPPENTVAGWWRAIGAVQGLLLGCVIVSLAWVGALLAFGVFHALGNVPRLFSNRSLLPWVIILIVGLLLAGWLIAWACGSLVKKAAVRERQRVEESIHEGVAIVAHEMVVIPAEQELAEYRHFREELRTAVGT